MRGEGSGKKGETSGGRQQNKTRTPVKGKLSGPHTSRWKTAKVFWSRNSAVVNRFSFSNPSIFFFICYALITTKRSLFLNFVNDRLHEEDVRLILCAWIHCCFSPPNLKLLDREMKPLLDCWSHAFLWQSIDSIITPKQFWCVNFKLISKLDH